MNIRTLDLNLLRAFDALMKERNVTSAAVRLGLTQPTLSNSLSRLRTACGDPLFVRTTHGMQPTAMAIKIARPIEDALAALQVAFDSSTEFFPAQSDRTFNVLMSDTGQLMFLPRLSGRIKALAPNIRIVVHQIPREDYRGALESGMADLAFGQLPLTHKDFVQQHLLDEPFVCLVSPAHVDMRAPMTLERFLNLPQLAIGPPAVSKRLVTRALGRYSSRRNVALVAPSYIAAPMIVATSGLVAIVPRTISQVFSGISGLRTIDLPFKMPPVKVRQFWHRRASRDPGIRWLRGVVAELFSDAGRASPLA